MKKLMMFVVMVLLFVGTTVLSHAGGVNVNIDGKAVPFNEAVPFIDANGRTLVPLRAIGEAMNLEVVWNDDAKTATFIRYHVLEDASYLKDADQDEEGIEELFLGKETVVFTIGSTEAVYNEYLYLIGEDPRTDEPVESYSNPVIMDTAAVIRDSRSYAPVRYLVMPLNCDVDWNAETGTVEVVTMKTIQQANIHMDCVAFWDGYQGWIYMSDDPNVLSMEIIDAYVNGESVTSREISEEEKAMLFEMGYSADNYKAGILIDNILEVDTKYSYGIRFLVKMQDGSAYYVTHVFSFLHDGGLGGIL